MCPHILRYLTTAVITNKDVRKRRQVLKDLVKVIQQVLNLFILYVCVNVVNNHCLQTTTTDYWLICNQYVVVTSFFFFNIVASHCIFHTSDVKFWLLFFWSMQSERTETLHQHSFGLISPYISFPNLSLGLRLNQYLWSPFLFSMDVFKLAQCKNVLHFTSKNYIYIWIIVLKTHMILPGFFIFT